MPSQSLQKTTLAMAALLFLAACGSSGSSSPSSQAADNSKQYSLSAQKKYLEKELAEDFGGNGFKKLDSYEVTINGKTYSGTVDLGGLGNGLQRLPLSLKIAADVNGQPYTGNAQGTLHLYQQQYSVVGGAQLRGGTVSGAAYHNPSYFPAEDLEIDVVKGRAAQNLPTVGTYRYQGVAFTQNEQGKLDYAVDFDKRKGGGSITGIAAMGKIDLKESSIVPVSHTNADQSVISGHGINGAAISELKGSGTYKLGFFGSNAEEIAGAVRQGNTNFIGFGGTKQ